MSFVEAASAEPAALAARNRQVTDPSAMPAGRDSSGLSFASIFTMARESTWLDSLLSRRGEAAGGRATVQQRAEKSTRADREDEKPREVNPPESSERSRRQDQGRRGEEAPQAESACQDEPRKEVKSRDDREQARAMDTDRGSADSTSREQTAEAARESQEDNQQETADSTENAPGEAEPLPVIVGPLPGLTILEPPVAGQMSAPAQEASVSVVSGPVFVSVVPGPVSMSPQTTSGASGPQMTTMSQPLPIQPVESQANSDAAGSRQDAAAAGASKNGEATARPGGSSQGFANLLDQVGRERGSAVARQGGPGAPVSGTDDGVKLGRGESLEQLARVVRSSLTGRTSSMTLCLDPPELGQLKVDVRMSDQNMVLRFQTETRAAHDLLETRLHELRHSLEQHGVRLDRVEVELRPPATWGQQGREADGQPRHGEPGSGQARNPQGESQGTYGSGDSENLPEEALSRSSAWDGSKADESGVPAETGVDLIV
ncbi:MAG TPA: flagellar hook-length control protein FliK [Phycisphaerae bacterium]|nr:flagellar hook-length control protein FliK [Phycisphaerae bacterium]